MYCERLKTLSKAYSVKRKDNETYAQALKSVSNDQAQAEFMIKLNSNLHTFMSLIAKEEERWQEGVLRTLESEIMQCLDIIFPTDGYRVELSARVLRGKMHIETTIKSYFAGTITGEIARSQGRLFQQTVSFAALVAVMGILGVNTVYVDEAFSGAAVANMAAVNKLVEFVGKRGFNLILIAQNGAIASGLDANILRVSRSVDNKTTVVMEG